MKEALQRRKDGSVVTVYDFTTPEPNSMPDADEYGGFNRRWMSVVVPFERTKGSSGE